MVEKIIINPTRVRAYGDIVNVKSDEDYEPVDCTITEDTDTVYGATVNVIVMEPDLGEATTLTVTSSSSTLVLDNTVNISATLKDSSNVAISGATITFKEGSTTLGTGTTNSSGVATYTYTGATTGSHTVSGVFGGDSTYASSTGSVSLTVNKKSTSTSLTTSSASVTVGTSVTLTATVTSGGSGVNGLTVTFKDGTSTLGTGTTNSSGVATYTTNSLTEGTHSITAVVTETSTYATSTSSAVSVVVSDHSYSLAFSQASYAATSGSATLSVTLTDNNVAVSGATVSVTGSDSSSYTGITNSNGIAEVTVTNVSAETTFTATYSNVSDTATVTVQSSVSSVSLTGTSNILSNYHNETCTLSATVLDSNNQGVSGETVTFYKGSNSIGTATTNASGVATKTYSSTGAGDVSFTAECNDITSSAYTVEDCLWFDAAVTGNTHSSDYSNFGSAPTLTVTTDGMKVSTTSGERWATIPILLTTDDDFELTYTYNGGTGYANAAEISSASNQRHTVFYTWLNDNTWSYTKNNTTAIFYTGAINVGDKIKIRRVNGVYTYYQNDIIRLNNLSNNSGGYVAFVTYRDGRYTIYKDIKVKAI